EGGARESYTVVLDSQPGSDVTIAISTGGQATVSPASLTFTPADWNTPTAVTVTAVDDSVVEGTHTDTIQHTATSADPGYAGITIPDVTVTITDNDEDDAWRLYLPVMLR